ncbi:LacI-type transcriptional regulator [Mycobacteroides abscessus subsp. abscessus]|nr:LacI-type transcriptional regulator [Mycobacteroides abscessus subsp. abscessus]
MTRNGRPPSMADVAELVGVSHQTVSRVVNGKGRVSPRTRERVQAVIEQLGYRPNSVARALVAARSGIIGVVTTTSAHFAPSSILVALEVVARKAGLFTSVVALDRFRADDVASAFDHFPPWRPRQSRHRARGFPYVRGMACASRFHSVSCATVRVVGTRL